ncbi:G-protein coupled receptor-associated protein LMBRD2 [Pelomyxa schiedti]|nr:G-protein coupled receptor-associated protein LMBRD2 [Pelomyxa schiedti]
MRDYINIIVKKCPAEYHEVRPLADGDSAISYSSVIKLHYNLKETEHLSNQSQTLFTKLLDTAFYLEDVVNSKGRPEHEVRWTFHKKCPRGFSFIEYLWCCYIKPRTMQFVGLLLALLSLVVVFSEVTFRWDDPTLSVFAILIHPAVVKQSSVLLIAILIGPLLFLVIATYSAFFSLRFFNYFRLIPNQLSSPNSIMFSAAYLCRLGPPLAFNFLYVIKFHGTAFEEVMSYMSDVPFFGGDKFLNNIPWLLVPMCLVSAFDIIPRIIRLLPCRRFTRYVYDDYDETQIEEGEHIIAEERVLKEKSMKCSETISRLTVNSQKDEELGISMDVITSRPDPEPKLAPKLPHCHQQHVESPLPSELKPTDPAPQARFRWFRRGSDDTQQPSLNVIQPNTISEKIERSSRDSPPPLIQEPVKPIPPPTQDKTRTSVTSSNITMHHNKYTNM